MLIVYGAIASICAIWLLYVTGRHHLTTEYMSAQWLAEYRARHSD
jgi:hypothetical protein